MDSQASRDLVSELQRNYGNILTEFLSIKSFVVDWQEKDLYAEGWQVFGLYDYPNGNPIQENIEQCPLTAEIIDKYEHGPAGFSILKAKSRIKPHEGVQGSFLRCHLGIICPKGDIGLNCNGINYSWREGQAFIFDDRKKHTAWNNSHEDRVILLVDFIP